MLETFPPRQVLLASSERGRVLVDSTYDVSPANRGRDVVVNASYCGVLAARFLGEHRPRGGIGVDCGVGPQGASLANVWYLEALNVPAAVADVMTVRLGDGRDLYKHGAVNFVNGPAADCGVEAVMSVSMAAELLLEGDPHEPTASAVSRMDDGLSTWNDGVISACNRWATEAGLEVGMSCQQATAALLARKARPGNDIDNGGPA